MDKLIQFFLFIALQVLFEMREDLLQLFGIQVQLPAQPHDFVLQFEHFSFWVSSGSPPEPFGTASFCRLAIAEFFF